MSPYLVLLILEFFPARLARLPHGLDSNVTKLLANLLTKSSVFYYLPIVSCNLVSIKLLYYYYYCYYIEILMFKCESYLNVLFEKYFSNFSGKIDRICVQYLYRMKE